MTADRFLPATISGDTATTIELLTPNGQLDYERRPPRHAAIEMSLWPAAVVSRVYFTGRTEPVLRGLRAVDRHSYAPRACHAYRRFFIRATISWQRRMPCPKSLGETMTPNL